MVNERGAQFFRYKFKLGEVKKSGIEEYTGAEVYFYDHSEEGAKAQLEKTFGENDSELIERKPW